MKRQNKFTLKDFKNYNSAIYNNEMNMAENLNNPDNSKYNGYLIFLNDLEEIKEQIKYDECKKLLESQNEKNNDWNLIFKDLKNLEKINIPPVKPIISECIKNLLLNKNKLILISSELFKVISDNNDESISFGINKNNQITFYLDEELKLQHNNFIFDEKSIKFNRSNFSEIKEIYRSVSKYYIFENNFKNELQNNTSQLKNGFLIRNSWFENWKKYTNYEKLKCYFDNQQNESEISEENKIKIINDIILYRAENKNLYSKPDKLEVIFLKDPKEFMSLLDEDDLIIIENSRHLSSFREFFPQSNFGLTSYSLIYGNIKINLNESLYFYADNNIISINNLISNEILDLIQLIKIYCFQEELQQLINYEDKNNTNFQNKNNIVLVNKNIIRKFKDNYGYKNLCDYFGRKKHILNDLIDKKEKIIRYELLTNDILNKIISNIKNKIPDINSSEKTENIYENINKDFDIKNISFEKAKKIQYIDDFEIINEDILSYFIEKKILYNQEVIKGEYVIGNGKIFLFFKYKGLYYHEIGVLSSSQDFKIKYIIKADLSKSNDLIIGIKNYGLKNLLDQNYTETDNAIWIDKKKLGNIYQIKENSDINNKEENNINESEEEIFFNNIISLLIKFFSFNRTILDKYNSAKTTKFRSYKKSIFNIDGYLINKKFINELKKLVPFDKIFKCFDTFPKSNELSQKDEKDILTKIIKEKNIMDELSKNQNKILNVIKNINNFIIEYKTFKNDNEPMNYPYDFDIINEDIFSLLSSLQEKNSKLEDKCSLAINNKKIIIKPDIINSKNSEQNMNNLLFGYSLNNNKIDNITYDLEIIFYFVEFAKRNNYFKEISNGKDIDLFYIDEKSIIIKEGKYKEEEIGQTFLIKKPINQKPSMQNHNKCNLSKKEFNSINKIDENNNDNYKQYFYYAIVLYREKEYINDLINNKIEPEDNSSDKETYYFINNNYMSTLESIIHFDDLKSYIKNLDLNEELDGVNDERINKLYSYVPNNIKEALNNMNEKKFEELNRKEIYELNPIQNEKNNNFYFYYENCQIINKQIYDLLSKIDSTFRKTEKFKSLDCCFTEKKVIIYFSYKIINIGHIDKKNIFYPELFIDSSPKSNLLSYFNVIKSKGFSIVFPFINDKEIIYQKSQHTIVKLKLYKFDDNEELDNNGQQFEEPRKKI